MGNPKGAQKGTKGKPGGKVVRTRLSIADRKAKLAECDAQCRFRSGKGDGPTSQRPPASSSVASNQAATGEK